MFQRYHYVVEQNKEIVPGMIELALRRSAKTPPFHFQPGQYATISCLVEGVNIAERPFSISSSPTDPDVIQFSLKVMGKYTTSLSKLSIGDVVMVAGPFGSFVFDEHDEREVVMIAGGIGITPFMSMIRYATERRFPHPITLIYSSRNQATTPFIDDIAGLGQRNPHLRWVVHLTDEKGEVNQPNLVQGRITAQNLRQYCQDVDAGAIFYLCGPTLFTAAMRENLITLGVKNDQIVTEEFALAPATFLPRDRRFVLATAVATTMVLLAFLYFINHTVQAQNLITNPSPSAASTIQPSVSSTTNSNTSSNSSSDYYNQSQSQTQNQNYQYVPQPRTRMS